MQQEHETQARGARTRVTAVNIGVPTNMQRAERLTRSSNALIMRRATFSYAAAATMPYLLQHMPENSVKRRGVKALPGRLPTARRVLSSMARRAADGRSTTQTYSGF